jgi:gamma-glutamylcyclotransferase (GGCT)/AIG2-like uncharacterized protein YtfP
MSRIFVYGSLKKEQSAHGFLTEHQATFVKDAVTTPEYHIYSISWFPGMVIDELMSGGVHGEVYEVSEACMNDLDRYEGAPGLFRREEITLADGNTAIAYLFNQNFSGRPRIESGVWDGNQSNA